MRKGLLLIAFILTTFGISVAQSQVSNLETYLPSSFKLALKNTGLTLASPLAGCGVCCDFEAVVEDCHDFEDFTLGNLIPQGNPKFTLFPNATQSAQVVLSPTDITNQCIIIFNDANIDYNINEGIGENQPTRLEWEMLVPEGKSGEWGLEVEPNSLYRLLVRYNSGKATVYSQGANNALTPLKNFNYSDTTWLKHAIIFKPNIDSIELWLNKNKIVTIGKFNNNKISQLNFYGVPGATQNEFYVDDLCFRVGANNAIGCPQAFDPVCVNGVQYDNSCLAAAAGYACEFTLGPCSVNPVGCSTITAPVNLSTGIDPSVNIKWTAAVGANSYRLLLGTTPGGSDILNVNVGNVLGYSITLLNYTTYYAKVIPSDGINSNNTCAEITFETGAIMTCNVCCAYSSSFADCFNFENFSVGNLITQVSPSFTLHTPSSVNAFIVNTPVFQGDRSLKGENGTNVDYSINVALGGSQAARAEWNMLVPAGKSGSWALETNAINIYPLGIKFENGIGTVFSRGAGGGEATLATANYSPNNWFKIAVIFQPQDDEIELFVNDVFVYKVANYTSNQVGRINFAAITGKANTAFYIDNLCYRSYDTSTITNNNSAPVCVNNENFVNLGLAEVKGYSSCETITGICNQKPGCTALYTPVSGQVDVSLNPIVSWSPVANALGYLVYVTSAGVPINNSPIDVQSATSIQLSNLASNTLICVRIIPYNAAGLNESCDEICFTTINIIQIPQCPQVTFPANGSSSVSLIPTITWNPGAFALGYRITVTTNNGNTVLISNRDIFNVTSYEIGPLPENTQVCVRISPYNNSGIVPSCNEVCFTTMQTIVPPLCTTVTNPTSNSQNVPINLALIWQPSAGATGYKINVTTDMGSTILYDNVDVGNDLSFPLIDLPYSSQICVRVTPYNQAGDRLNCQEHCFNTVAQGAQVPACPNITYPLMDEINVLTAINAVWTASANATGYIVNLVQENGTIVVDSLDVGNVTSYIINSLPFSTRLCLTIIPYNAMGQNLTCDSRCFTTVSTDLIPDCATISYPIADAYVPTSFVARWSTPPTATGYIIRLVQENGTVIINNENIAEDTILISGLADGVSYCLNVYPYNNVGQNLTCTSVCFTVDTILSVPNCPTITYPISDTIVTPTSFNATWTAASGATGYFISLISSGGTVILDSVDIGNVLTYALDSLNSDSIFCLSIIPYNAAGSNLNCNSSCFTTTADVQLPSCAAITYPMIDELNVLVSINATWTASPTATGYIIRLTQENGTIIINNQDVGNVTNYTINNLPNSTRLCLTIIPYNSAGQNLNCTATCFTTVSSGETPACPTIAYPTPGDINIPTTFLATWVASAGATGYLLRLEEENGAIIINNLDIGNVTSFAINNLTNAKRYCLKVIPYNAFGQNLTCTATCFTTIAIGNLAACPMINYPSANETNVSTSFLARWSSSPAATGYLLRLEEENGPVIINNLNLGNLFAYRFNNLPNEKRLCLSIYPYNAAGQNLTCNKLCFTTAMISATDEQLANQVRIHPNPTRDIITVDSGGLAIEKMSLMSIDGSIQKEYQGTATEIDLSNFVSGVYLLKIYTGDRMIVKKVVKVD